MNLDNISTCQTQYSREAMNPFNPNQKAVIYLAQKAMGMLNNASPQQESETVTIENFIEDVLKHYPDYPFQNISQELARRNLKGPSTPISEKESKSDSFVVENEAAQRFAKLIYTQLKLTVMKIDYNRKMKLEVEEVQRFVSQVLHANNHETQEITNMVCQGKQALDYEEFLQFIVPFYFCKFYVNTNMKRLKGQNINQELFLEMVKDATTTIITVEPSEKIVKSLFYLAAGNGDEILNMQQYVMLMGRIFQNFRFDHRGRPT